MHPPSQHPHKLVATTSHCTTGNQPNRSIYPETKPGHADDRALCPDAQTIVRQPPYVGTHHGQQGPGRHRRGLSNTARTSHSLPSNSSLNSVTTPPLLRESHHYHHTHALLPAPEDPDANKLNPIGPSGALTAYTSFIFLCTCRVSGQPGLARPPAPQHCNPTSCTRRHRSADTPTTCPAHHP